MLRPPEDATAKALRRAAADTPELWSNAQLVQQVHDLQQAIINRDVIGQAKGVVIASTGCTSDEAFDILRNQSQHENRKLSDIARVIVHQATRPRRAAVHDRSGRVVGTAGALRRDITARCRTEAMQTRIQLERDQDAIATRDRIATDFNDHIMVRLFDVGMTLNSIVKTVEPDVAARVTAAIDELDATIVRLRSMMFALFAQQGDGHARG